MNWRSQRAFDGPAAVETMLKTRPSTSEAFGPLGHSHSDALEADESVCSPIVCLFFPSCPTYVTRFISASVVYPVKRGAWWAWAYVSIKCREVIAPFFTHLDTAAAIIVEVSGLRIMAPIFCVEPSVVFPATRSAMSDSRLSSRFIIQTAATLCESTFQVLAEYSYRSSARTEAFPLWHSYCTRNTRKNSQSSEYVACNVY